MAVRGKSCILSAPTLPLHSELAFTQPKLLLKAQEIRTLSRK
jgi:hypothetical protein